MSGKIIYRHLTAHQCPEDLHPGGIGEHPEHLDDEVHLIVGQPPSASLTICIHTQIIGQEYR
ncbi:hypothetical protein MLIT_26880 [Mycolicibacterium litorale]|uniref:Uncharacterized protein n=1 Tax=Mycolicibacterium litorale TaxID=758802 RepID=A0AAD1ILQ8_9MYCO|nr:hypothetical protein MLIT_26880 [Mycolicibacterium litorale]